MVLARYRAVPSVKECGHFGERPLVAFTSEESHYSIRKAVHWLGIGTNNLICVKSDANGRMCVDDLVERIEEALAHNRRPFFVNATAGTTILGAFDNLGEIADVCRRYNIWMHVDVSAKSHEFEKCFSNFQAFCLVFSYAGMPRRQSHLLSEAQISFGGCVRQRLDLVQCAQDAIGATAVLHVSDQTERSVAWVQLIGRPLSLPAGQILWHQLRYGRQEYPVRSQSGCVQILVNAQSARSARFWAAHGQCYGNVRIHAASARHADRLSSYPNRTVPIHKRVLLVHSEMHARS